MSTSLLRLGIVSVFVCAQLVAGCGDDDDNDDDAGSFAGNSSGSGGHAGSSHVAGTGGRAGSGGSSALDAGPDGSTIDAGEGDALTDKQILAVLKAANTGEISLGLVALDRSNLGIVRTFSQTMIDDHGETQQAVDAIANRFNLVADANPVSEALTDDVDAALSDLQDASAEEFDLLYALAQIKAHTAVLKLIDDELLPSVTNADLREELETIRAAVAHHLELARDLRDAIEALSDADAGLDDDAGL